MVMIDYDDDDDDNNVEIIPLLVGCLAGGIGRLLKNAFRVIVDQIKAERTIRKCRRLYWWKVKQ